MGGPGRHGGEAGEALASHGATDEADLPEDLLCIHCGYNLRGLSPGGRCPECGTPIGQSLRGDLLSSADPEWLARIHRGQLYIAVGIVVFLAAIPAGPLLSLFTFVLDAPTYVLEGAKTAHSILSMLLVLLGVVALTTLDPRLSLSEQPLALRRVVRAAAFVALLVAPLPEYLDFLRHLNVSVDRWVSVTIPVAAFITLGFTVVAASYYLAHLAQRIPDEDLARRTMKTAREFAVLLVGLYVVVPTLEKIFSAVKSAPWSTGYTGVLVEVLAGVLLALAVVIFGIGFVITAIYLAWIWWTYRKVFKRCLVEARGVVVREQEAKTVLANDAFTAETTPKLVFAGRPESGADLQDLDKGVEMCTRMVVQDGQTELECRLAANLHRRAIALAARGCWGAGLQDLDKAIGIFTRLVEKYGKSELADELTRAREDRDLLRKAMGTSEED
ncbi:MAG: hypothetical protein JSU86_02210 [Phycisphaerales bacterium]|nr:MAG: hypothetical protein JSU86_02210 [Phycisphaerales bacterium]